MSPWLLLLIYQTQREALTFLKFLHTDSQKSVGSPSLCLLEVSHSFCVCSEFSLYILSCLNFALPTNCFHGCPPVIFLSLGLDLNTRSDSRHVTLKRTEMRAISVQLQMSSVNPILLFTSAIISGSFLLFMSLWQAAMVACSSTVNVLAWSYKWFMSLHSQLRSSSKWLSTCGSRSL